MVDRGYAWVVLAASTASLAIAGLLLYCSGIFHIVLLEQFHAGHVVTSWAGALFSCNFMITAPIASWLINTFSCRVTMMTSGVLFATSFLLTAFAPNALSCIFTLGVLGGIAGAMVLGSVSMSLGYHFKKKLTVAFGIAGMGIGVGIFALSPLMQTAIDQYSYTSFFILIAGVGLQFVVLGALMKPSKAEIKRKVASKNLAPDTFEMGHLAKLKTNLNSFLEAILKMFRHKGLLFLTISQFIHGFGFLTVFYFLPSYCRSVGTPPMQTALLMSFSGAGSFFGRGLLGLATSTEDVDVLTAYFSLYGCTGILTMCFPLMVHNFAGQIIFSTVFGTFIGSINSIFSPLLIKIVGLHEHSHGFGCTYCSNGIGNLLGTYVAASIADHGGGFQLAFIIAGVANLLASFCGMAIPVLSKYNQPSNEDTGRTIEIQALETKSLMDAKQEAEKC